MGIRSLKISRRHNHSHEVRSKIHNQLVSGLQGIQDKENDDDDDKNEREDSTTRKFDDFLKAKEKEKLEPRKSSSTSFKPRQLATRRPARSPTEPSSEGHIEAPTPRLSRMLQLGESGSHICTCPSTTDTTESTETPKEKTSSCPVHPFGY